MVKNKYNEAMIDRAMRFGNSSVKFAGAQMERRLARGLISRRYGGPVAVPLSLGENLFYNTQLQIVGLEIFAYHCGHVALLPIDKIVEVAHV